MSEEICFFAHLIVTLQIISAKLFRFDKKEPFLYSRLFKKATYKYLGDIWSCLRGVRFAFRWKTQFF